MSNRIVKHSSRYKGPSGDSRAPAEIFAGIEAREVQAQMYYNKLLALMDEVMANANLCSWECRADIVREAAVDWLKKNHPDFMEEEREHDES